MQAAVIDSNVVVAALLSRNLESPTRRILKAMLKAEIRFLLSPDLLQEYAQVLLRPKIRQIHGLEPTEVRQLMECLLGAGVLREPNLFEGEAPDPNDAHLWALLAISPGSILVTGDRRLLDHPPDFASVIAPVSYCQLVGL